MHNSPGRWRRIRATACVAALITAVLLCGLAAHAGGIMLQIKEVPLKEVVGLLMQQSGANVVIQDASTLDRRVTASLNDVPLEKALDYIVRSAGVSYRKMEDGTYIIGGSISDVPPLPKEEVAADLAPVVETQPAPEAPRPQETFTAVIKLKHTRPSETLALLGWTGRNPMPTYDVVHTTLNKSGGPRQDGGLYLTNTRGETYDASHGAFTQNGQRTIPSIDPASLNPGAGRTADWSTGAAQYPESGVSRPYQAQPGAPPRPGGPTTTTTTTSPTATTTGQDFLMPEGITAVRPFDLDNSIIAMGTEDGIAKLKQVIKMLDVAPKQVQIKAEFVEVRTNDVKAFGIDWSLQRINESFATAFNPTGDVVIGFATGNLTAVLRTQLTTNIGTVVNSPIISTINNMPATIEINQQIPYWQSMATVVGDNNVINQSYVNYLDVSTRLLVTPRVNGDGTITMQLQPQVEDTGSLYTGPDGTVIPETRGQALTTMRRVANGETIVVGGFIRKNDSQSFKKIPVLSSLPLVGSLFRTVNKTTEDRELLIFVTPTIIPDVTGASVGVSLTP